MNGITELNEPTAKEQREGFKDSYGKAMKIMGELNAKAHPSFIVLSADIDLMDDSVGVTSAGFCPANHLMVFVLSILDALPPEERFVFTLKLLQSVTR